MSTTQAAHPILQMEAGIKESLRSTVGLGLANLGGAQFDIDKTWELHWHLIRAGLDGASVDD